MKVIRSYAGSFALTILRVMSLYTKSLISCWFFFNIFSLIFFYPDIVNYTPTERLIY